MGSSSSKFRRYLQNGDEYAALQVFQSTPELQHNLDPNSSYGDSLKHNTPLHLVAKHAMKPLLRIFLTELNGNPNKQNALGETPLHLVCQCDVTRSAANLERRAQCLSSLLLWHTDDEKLDLAIEDSEKNTALHYAAASGLKKCVEILIAHGAPLFIVNKSFETVCDLAEKNRHEDIAQYLETKMLFYTDDLDNVPCYYANVTEELESGLRAQDLQEAKDQLLVETSDMFHVPLFTAEVLLRNHEWSRQSLLDSWMKDPIACCKDAGVPPPSSAINFSTTQDSLKLCCEQIQNEYQNETLNSPARTVVIKEEVMCDICLISNSSEDLIQIPCLHQFCKNCWTTYLTAKIVEGEAHHIFCPAFECPHLVPVDVIERLVSSDMVKRYLQFDIKAFVESNPSMKWCPSPGCARAVKVPKIEKVNDEILAISFSAPPPTVSHAVDCGNGHYFCWECLGEAHAPSGCEKWREWHNKIAEIKPQELKNTYSETEAAENSLWMVTNSKPCPNCKCPIQKNEGCNHMKCSKCKYEYCWVCLESWKKHGPGTGGYFRCNRHDAAKRAEVKTESLINQAEEHNKHMQELKRFLQYYTRFKNHENSYKFEEPFLKTLQEKISILLASVDSESVKNSDLSFLEEAIYELLRARRILCGAYVYGFYLEDNGYNKTIFEYLQNDLEESTVKLSEAVARTYLQTPKNKIIQMTSQVRRKRLDLLTAVNKGLIPPETPPSMRKSRKRRLPGLMGMDPIEDPQLSQAILESLENIDPNDPWVVDENGKHTNVAAVCDWPDYDSEDDESSNPFLSSVLGVCSREGCNRPRAKNCRTGEMHEFCSLACKHWDLIKSPDTEVVTAHIDPTMDMLIALEMSKLEISCLRNENERSLAQNMEPMNFMVMDENDPENTAPKTIESTLTFKDNIDSVLHKKNSDVACLSDKDEAMDSSLQEQLCENSDHEALKEINDAASSSKHEQNDNVFHNMNEQEDANIACSTLDKEEILGSDEEEHQDNNVYFDSKTELECSDVCSFQQQNDYLCSESPEQPENSVDSIAFDERDNCEQLDNYFESTICENISNSTVITSESAPLNFPFSCDRQNPDLSFYLKSSCDEITKNINVNADKNCSKTDKELFKVFQHNTDTNGCYEAIPSNEKNTT